MQSLDFINLKLHFIKLNISKSIIIEAPQIKQNRIIVKIHNQKKDD